MELTFVIIVLCENCLIKRKLHFWYYQPFLLEEPPFSICYFLSQRNTPRLQLGVFEVTVHFTWLRNCNQYYFLPSNYTCRCSFSDCFYSYLWRYKVTEIFQVIMYVEKQTNTWGSKKKKKTEVFLLTYLPCWTTGSTTTPFRLFLLHFLTRNFNLE